MCIDTLRFAANMDFCSGEDRLAAVTQGEADEVGPEERRLQPVDANPGEGFRVVG